MRHAQSLQGHPETRSMADRAWSLARRTWAAYWARKAEQATLLILHSLDDRTLKDIGLDRSEIEFVVYTATRGRHASCRSAERRIAMCV